MNYFLHDIVEQSNFVSRERLLSCARPADKEVIYDRLGLGIDWARESDETVATLVTPNNEIVGWWVYPHITYEQQLQLMLED